MTVVSFVKVEFELMVEVNNDSLYIFWYKMHSGVSLSMVRATGLLSYAGLASCV